MSKELFLDYLKAEGFAKPADYDTIAEKGVLLVEEICLRGDDGVQTAIEDLDEEVHTVMDEYSGSESEAEMSAHGSRVNNEGLSAQLACILAAYGVVEGEQRVRKALDMPEPGAQHTR